MKKDIFDAIEFAAKAHRGQFRKGTKVPYIIHPMRVAKTLIQLECPEKVAMAGILHDVLEDTPVSFQDLEAEFGKEIAALVKGASESNKSDTWENRKTETIEFLKTSPLDVLLIIFADKLDNIQTMKKGFEKIGEEFWDRFNRPMDQQAWYYKSLVEVFLSREDCLLYREIFEQFRMNVEQVFQ